MSDALTPKQTSASPYSTGGGGVRFEHRVAAVFLTRLLAQRSVSELGERVPALVAFQQSPATTVDDLVVTAKTIESKPNVRLEIAVRRAPKFIKSHDTTKALILALVRADLAAERAADPLLEIRLAVAVSGQQAHAREVAALASVARSQPSAGEFFALVNTPGKFATSGRLMHIRDMVSEAINEIADPAAGTAEHRCWCLLARLWIMSFDLEAGHDAHWTALVDDLMPLAHDHSHAAAIGLRDRLEQLSGEFAQCAAAIDATVLRRHLHGQIDPCADISPPGWPRLLSLDKEARSGVSRSLAAAGAAASLTLPRQAVRDGLRAEIDAGSDLIVKGDSGVGKSALVMDAIEPIQLGQDRQAIAINLRDLPDTQLELLSHLLSPLDELLGRLTAPHRMLVIDGAEAAAEAHGPVFSHLVRCARDAGLQVVAIAATEGAGVAADRLRSGVAAPREYVIPWLSHDEIAIVAEHFPGLQRLAQDVRARELLRRPIVVDLLARAGDPGLPLSEAQALDHIWYQLVRNGGRRHSGAPDARDQAMVSIAEHAVRKGEVDDLLARLDNAAVDGLRRSGLILPANGLPWERAPKFTHDLLRAYSVARYLLRERDPASALMSVGAPRWTLPSARLAAEILLSAPVQPLHPRAGRFAQLQASFDEIVAAGHGERWADVPTEALLAVPEAHLILEDAWSTLLSNQALGLRRMIRILHGRHQRDGLLDPIIAEPVISRLLREDPDSDLDSDLADEVAKLVRDWLRTHIVRGTRAGQPTRIALREAILTQCAENDRVLEEEADAARADLAARTPDEVAEDEKREKALAPLMNAFSSRRRRPRKPLRRRPYLWIAEAQVEHLALLGPDLGSGGEAILRRIAEDEPHSLDHAVEPPLAGHSLAAYDPKLLIDLAGAYYIDDDDDDDGFGALGGLREDGVRAHRFGGGPGSPLAAFTRGPFLAMFQADYRGGVAFLNMMLNHAARCRVRTLSHLRYGPPTDEGTDDGVGAQHTHILSITGEPRTFVGDGHVWLWYRGTGVGPYPCMSALQALEFVSEEFIRAGVPVRNLLRILYAGAESLAMPALVLGILVRHLEEAGDALDRYLVEPLVWDLEFSRATNERIGRFAARGPELENSERRGWSLREVSMVLALLADGERSAQLKDLGRRLLANARSQFRDFSSPGAQLRLAIVQKWAASLDRNAYDEQHEEGRILYQQSPDPEVEQVLGETNEEFRRGNDALGLIARHAHVRDKGARAPNMTEAELNADLVTARDLLENPPQSGLGTSRDGPVAVAASALELHLTGRARVRDDDLLWSAGLLLRIAAEVAKQESDSLNASFFAQAADRSAARALPFLLLPAAHDLRTSIGVDTPEKVQELLRLSGAIASKAPDEARLEYARGLDAVWAAPCDESHFQGRCHHRIALELVGQSFLDAIVGPWERATQRRKIMYLAPPNAASFEAVDAKDILVQRLTPAIRAAGSAAVSSICCKQDARETVENLIAAHQRAMLAFERDHQSHSGSLVAARAALWQAIDGRDEPALAYVERYLGNSRILAECLQAIAAAAEERAGAGDHARRLWPKIMDRVLDAVEADPRTFCERPWGEYAEARLIPNRSTWGYTTSEAGESSYAWRDPLSWAPQIKRWLGASTGARMSVDHLVTAVRELAVSDQLEAGLSWIEEIVVRAGSNCAHTFTLPEWLHERRADILTDEQLARWQRIVDLLVVAGDSRVADLAD